MSRDAALRPRIRSLLGGALGLAYGAGLVLHLVHRHESERHEVSPWLHWLRDSSLAIPVAVVSVLAMHLAIRMLLGWAAEGRTPSVAARHAVRGAAVLAGTTVYAVLSVPGNLVHRLLFIGEHQPHEALAGIQHLAADGAVAGAAAFLALTLTGPRMGRTEAVLPRPQPAAVPGWPKPAAAPRPSWRTATAASSATAVFAAMLVAPLAAAPANAAPAAPAACNSAGADREYEVAAISVPIPYNRFGDLDPNGMVYVLEQDRRAVDHWFEPLATNPADDVAQNRRLRPRPLVLRANQGECVQVTFTNRLNTRVMGGSVTNPRASMHVAGAAYDVQTSDGSRVGYNEDTTVAIGQSITYHWRAPAKEGLLLFKDTAMSAGSEADGGSIVHGLWGALAVEPTGSTWFDPHSGLPLYPPSSVSEMSGELYIDADIVPPTGNSFRESVQVSQDEIVGIGFGFNYGADPQDNRDQELCPDCVGEETSLSSWTYGDPASVKLASGGGVVGGTGWPVKDGVDPEDCQSDTGAGRAALMMPVVNGKRIPASCWTSNVTHAYVGDPTKIRFAHVGVKETHVFHMHAHQWLSEPHDVGAAGTNPTTPSDERRPEATTIDSQTYGPADTFTADLLFGAGSRNGTVGDAIFHCHLYPHFAEGFWSLFRTHDVLEDGTLRTPDGIRTRTLVPLPDRVTTATGLPPAPTADNPGYPRFIPGRYGWRAPQPPNTVSAADGTPATRIVAGQGLLPALLNEVQKVSTTSKATDEEQRISNVATGGTFTLSLGADTSTPLPFNASASEVQSALEALLHIGTGNVAVTSDESAGQAWTVTFTGALGRKNVETLVATDSFAPGDSTTVVTVREGANGGTFTLAYRGDTTASLPFDASASAVKLALEALSTIETVAVTGTGTSADPWVVTFASPNRNVRALTATEALSEGSVAITTQESDLTSALATERAVQLRRYGNAEPKPGAPLADPCPAGAREVTYDVTVMQTDIVYNEEGWHDTQGRLLVRTVDVPAILAGTKKAEPLFIRVNAGDCVNFNLTNRLPNWYGNDAFQVLQQTNMFGEHIHLVKFDVLGSDGSSNGWNYQQAAFSQLQAEFGTAVLNGDRPCSADEANGACRLPLPGPDGYSPTAQITPTGQTIHERWYADYELRTVFTHDHHFPAVDQGRGLFGALIVEPAGRDFRDSKSGNFQQPINDPAHGTVCTNACEGTAAGAMYDIIGPGASDDFREFGLAFQDFVPLTRAGGNPQDPADVFNPPEAPETYANDDPGVMGVNYRNAPYLIRNSVNGVRTDPAYVYSSTLHGDPATPILSAYSGDPVRIRLVAGSQEEQHNFSLHGMRWRDEPDDPQSPLVGSRSLGVSDAFNFEIPEMECAVNTDCRGDYLYTSAGTDDAYLGMWGLMRVFGKGTKDLRPLPDNIPQAVNGTTSFAVTKEPPPPANKPGNACPTGAPIKAFRIAATDAKITYDAAGDHDPYGLVYVAAEPGETVDQAVARARANPTPMAIRANEGDCLEVTLVNKIDPNGGFARTHAPLGAADGDPHLPLEPPTGTPAGLRVSLHAQLLKYDVRGSDGATVGFNRDQSVAPGGSILYRWYADDVSPGELGAINLTDYGDVRGHRHHGLFASLTIEPKGATYHDPITGEAVTSAASADIRVPGQADFREFTTMLQDGLNLRDANGALVPDGSAHAPVPGEVPEELDSEDQGEKGFNYASEPFRHRLGMVPMAADATSPLDGGALANVFSTRVHGDPATPVFRAYAGDPVRVRVVQGADKPRQNSFAVAGHSWFAQPDDPGTDQIGARGGMTVNRAMNLELGAAGAGRPGDHLYSNPVGFHHLSGGMWGILRVYQPLNAGPLFRPDVLAPGSTSLTTGDNPFRTDYSPLQPLERTSVTVSVYDDSNADGLRAAAEKAGVGVDVTLRSTDGATAVTQRADASGRTTFHVGRGAYDVSTTAPADWQLTTAGKVRVDLTAENAHDDIAFGVVQLADIGVRIYKDANGDNLVNAGEPGLSGWSVKISKGADVRTATTGTDGTLAFDGLLPGTWSVTSPGQPGWITTRNLPVSVVVAENDSRASKGDTALGFALKAGLSVKLFNDSNKNGVQDPGESNKAGWKVTASGGPPERRVTVTATTDAQGTATFEDPSPEIVGLTPGAYTLAPTLQSDWSLSSGSATTTTDTGSGSTPGFACQTAVCETVLVTETTQVATLALHNPHARVVALPFIDANNDGVHQSQEGKLVGWTVGAVRDADGVRLEDRQTGNDGRADFYPLKPGTYTVDMISPEPSADINILDWTTTNRSGCTAYGTSQKRCTVTLTVTAGETGTASFGFVQLGTVGVRVFHDYDRDAQWDAAEPVLANRTATLYNSTGKTVLQTKVTDDGGRVAFKVTAGTKYLVAVTTPSGWVATAPLDSKGAVVAKLAVTGPTGTQSLETEFAQYNTADSVPPPAPAPSVPGGQYAAVQVVSLASETGATIRYTLDGSLPSATSGMRYAGPVVIGGTRTLRAVAFDNAGNVSAELGPEDPTLPRGQVYVVSIPGTTLGSGTPGSWTVLTGGPPSGSSATALAADDASRLLLPSSYVSKTKQYTVDGYASVTIPPGERDLATLGLAVDAKASLGGVTRAIWLYDWTAAAWTRVLADDIQPTSDNRSIVYASGDVRRFVSTAGEVRVRDVAVRTSGSFDLALDQVLIRFARR